MNFVLEEEMTLYEILGVKSDCSMKILRENYHRLLLEYHPDKSKSTNEKTEKHFQEIQHAYEILSNIESRRKYDEEQQRVYLHALPHTNVDSNDFNDDNEYPCRCGTILSFDKNSVDSQLIECPNCSMKIQWKEIKEN